MVKEGRTLVQLRDAAPYDEKAKALWRTAATALLRQAAKDAGVMGTGSLRWQAGGIGVAGEAVFHGERVYVTTVEFMHTFPVMVRSCRGTKDYAGGCNEYPRDYDGLVRRMAELGGE